MFKLEWSSDGDPFLGLAIEDMIIASYLDPPLPSNATFLSLLPAGLLKSSLSSFLSSTI